jgi:hypothetical protein
MNRRLAAIFALSLAGAACSAGDSTTTVDTTPALSAKFDGTTWTATSVTATFAAGYLNVTATGLGTFTFALIANAPGTYTIGPNSAVTTTYTLLSSTWTANSTIGSGSVTINSFTTSSASGTFSFLIPAVTSTAATGYKTVATGTFTVRF